MQKHITLLLILAVTALACERKTEAEILLDRCMNAHGGLERWNQFEGLAFQVYGDKDTLTSYNQLRDRRTHLIGPNFEEGFDGVAFWTKGDTSLGAIKNPAFFHNLDFYFFAFPFVMADQGVKLKLANDEIIENQAYKVLEARFAESVGAAPNDVYKLYIHPETHHLDWLQYAVTYFDSTNTKFSLKQYKDWQDVQGVLVPENVANFAKDSTGQPSGNPYFVRKFANVHFYEKFDERLLEPES
ncbi:hypothetical protein LAG90_07895 [Marinilongibacter aquaticus]|uniref:DUF6503 family protein n=1 Tax=Marinilongibacter aquaticus TaxID=2975157 RepID=UPI0021BDA208|nr:DUF6503 family protein [Marinilongibacter aquaticus]UBM60562.1 hypothetical protein LAG90_07895 [Marinilongibacter aquaticus]